MFGGTFTIAGENYGAPGTTAVVQITYGGVTETATGPTVASHTSDVQASAGVDGESPARRGFKSVRSITRPSVAEL